MVLGYEFKKITRLLLLHKLFYSLSGVTHHATFVICEQFQ